MVKHIIFFFGLVCSACIALAHAPTQSTVQSSPLQPVVEDTALMVAFWRADQRPDRYSLKMIEGKTRPQIADVLIRAKKDADLPVYFRQDYLKSLLRDTKLQYQQVIILGSGLSPLSAEFASGTRPFIEMDLSQDNLAYKNEKYQALDNVELEYIRLIAGDYIEDFAKITADALFAPKANTLVILEGNTMYLTKAAFEQTLANLAANLETVDVAFDFFSDTVVNLKWDYGLTTNNPDLDNWARSPVGKLFKTGYNKQSLQFRGYETKQALWMAELADVGDFQRSNSIIARHSGVCLLRKAPT